ncbi:MAG: AAA family ATPase [Patescibacteria group bacterium]
MEKENIYNKYEKILNAYKKLYNQHEELLEKNETLAGQNQNLSFSILELKSQLEIFQKEVEKLTAPPLSCGIFLEMINVNAFISIAGREMNVSVDSARVDGKNLKKGDRVILNESLVIIGVLPVFKEGGVGIIKDFVDDRAIVEKEGMSENFVFSFAKGIREIVEAGDRVRYLESAGLIYEKLPKTQISEFEIKEAPNVTYEQIAGLEKEIEAVREAIELPLLYPEKFKEYVLSPSKGILFWGPPGCGKTIMAKAVANSLMKELQKKYPDKKIKSYFLNIRGPEILNKFVGESERIMRDLFKKAREKTKDGGLVVMFFDEMESLLRVRGSGISSDVESTIVPQFLAELDGLESNENIIVIGASNRYDLIDPAVLREERVGKKIEFPRPTEVGMKNALEIYLTKPRPVPISAKYLDKTNEAYNKNYEILEKQEDVIYKKFIPEIVKHIYAKEWEFYDKQLKSKMKVSNKLGDIVFISGKKESVYFSNLLDYAMAKFFVDKAKLEAIKRFVAKKEDGVLMEDFHKAIEEKVAETKKFIKNIAADPNQASSIFSKKTERISHIEIAEDEITRVVESVSVGHYL